MRTLTKVRLAQAMVAACFMAPAAIAQEDGSTAAEAASQKQNISVSCGAPTASLVRTENAGLTFSNTSFATLPGSAVTVRVPAGNTRCVKVLFTAEAGATNFCYVQAVLNGTPMLPNGGGLQSLVSNDTSNNAHGFQWVRRVGAGSHTIAIQRRVSAGRCNVDDWAVNVEVTR